MTEFTVGTQTNNGLRRVNWSAAGVLLALGINIVVLVWNASTLVASQRDTAATLREVQANVAAHERLRMSADSALIAGLHWLDTRMTRAEVRIGLPTPRMDRP